MAENPRLSWDGGEIWRETDCLLERNGFELPVPRAMQRRPKAIIAGVGCKPPSLDYLRLPSVEITEGGPKRNLGTEALSRAEPEVRIHSPPAESDELSLRAAVPDRWAPTERLRTAALLSVPHSPVEVISPFFVAPRERKQIELRIGEMAFILGDGQQLGR